MRLLAVAIFATAALAIVGDNLCEYRSGGQATALLAAGSVIGIARVASSVYNILHVREAPTAKTSVTPLHRKPWISPRGFR